MSINVSEILGIAGVVVGLVGVLVGIAYGRRSGRPVFKQKGDVVVRASPRENITVQHSRVNVPGVTRTRIAVWNAGHKTLENSSIVRGYPIRFLPKGGEARVLSATIIKRSDDANKFETIVSEDAKTVQIAFDYLDHRQGGLIEILHTSDKWGVVAAGRIKGLPGGIREVRDRSTLMSFLSFLAIQGCIVGGGQLLGNLHQWQWRILLVAGAVLVGGCAFYIYRRMTYEPKEISFSRK